MCDSLLDAYEMRGCCTTPHSLTCIENGKFQPLVDESASWIRILDLQREADDDYTIGNHYDFTEFNAPGSNSSLCPFSFASTLSHHPPYYWPTCDDVRALASAANCPSLASFENIPVSPRATRRLYAITDTTDLLPQISRSLPPTDFTPILSGTQAWEMAELYVMAYLRDCPITPRMATRNAMCREKRTLSVHFLNTHPYAPVGGVSDDTLLQPSTVHFRHAAHTLVISQLLLTPFSYGMRYVGDRRISYDLDDHSLWTREGLLDNEEAVTGDRNQYVSETRYPYSGRMIGSLVHNEPAFSHYTDAALICMGELTSRYNRFDISKATSSLNGGFEDILASVTEVGRIALMESYRAKYRTSLKLRPQQYAQRADTRARLPGVNLGPVQSIVDNVFSTQDTIAFMERLRSWKALQTGHDNHLLPSHFASSRHPSWTHGHGTLAGACITTLKALLRLEAEDGSLLPWTRPALLPSEDGTALENVDANDGLTFVSELDKLALNVAIGRNYAGQHFRTEMEASLRFGESIALKFLRSKMCLSTTDLWDPIVVDLFNGTRVRVSACERPIEIVSQSPRPSLPPSSSPVAPMVPSSSIVVRETLSRPFVFDDEKTPASFMRLLPKPAVAAQFAGAVLVSKIRLRQTQMSFGDSTTRRAVLTLHAEDGSNRSFPVLYEVPSLDGAGGTLLTTHVENTYGRIGMPAFVEVLVDPPVKVLSFNYTVTSIYPYSPPESPVMFGGRGYNEDGTPIVVADFQPTVNFFGTGTWDVGLRDIELWDGESLVAESTFEGMTMVTTADDMNYEMAWYDRPENMMLNPYRTFEERHHFKESWPCALNTASPDCSNSNVSHLFAYPGWVLSQPGGIHSHRLLPMASPENFMKLYPKPLLTARLSHPVRVRRIGLRQRHMAFADATIRNATIILNGDYEIPISFGMPSSDGSTATLLTNFTHPSPDAFGRGGLSSEILIEVPDDMKVRELQVRVDEIHRYMPPVEFLSGLTEEDIRWSVSRMEREHERFHGYVHPTMGSWNVGFTHVSLYPEATGTVLVSEGELLRAQIASNGAFDEDVFEAANPFYNPYRAHEDQVFDGGIYKSWCFLGQALLSGSAVGFRLSETEPVDLSDIASPPPLSPVGEIGGEIDGETGNEGAPPPSFPSLVKP